MTLFLFLLQSQRHVTDLYEDLRDGHNLISLLEVLSGDTLVSIRHDVRILTLAGSNKDTEAWLLL